SLEQRPAVAAGRYAGGDLAGQEGGSDLEVGLLVDSAQGRCGADGGGDHARTEVGAWALGQVAKVVLEDELLGPLAGVDRALLVDHGLQPLGDLAAELPDHGFERPGVARVERVHGQRLSGDLDLVE